MRKCLPPLFSHTQPTEQSEFFVHARPAGSVPPLHGLPPLPPPPPARISSMAPAITHRLPLTHLRVAACRAPRATAASIARCDHPRNADPASPRRPSAPTRPDGVDQRATLDPLVNSEGR